MAETMKDVRWSDALLAELVGWLEEAYPAEGCGLVLEDREGKWAFQRCENVIDKYHAVDPEAYPRTSREFYMIDPREFMKAEDRGQRVAAIVHSHPDVGDYFSADDAAAAVMPRESEEEPVEPIYPGTDYLVVSVRKGRADGASLFRFAEEAGAFRLAGRFDEARVVKAVNGKAEPIETVA